MGASSGALRLPLAPHSGVPPPSPAAAQGGRGHPPQRRRQRPHALPLVARARRRPRLDRQARRDLLQLGAGDDTPPSPLLLPTRHLPMLSGWCDCAAPHSGVSPPPLPLALQRVFVEFFATGDAQKARHFDVQPFMDREQVVMPPLTPSPVRHHVGSPPPTHHPSSLSPPTAHPWHTLPHRLLTWQPPWTARRRPSPRRSRAS